MVDFVTELCHIKNQQFVEIATYTTRNPMFVYMYMSDQTLLSM